MTIRKGSKGLVCNDSRISSGAMWAISLVRPRDLRRQGYDTLAQGDEQASRHEVGGGAGVAAVAVCAEPGVEIVDGPAAGVGVRPAGVKDRLCSATGFLR